MRHFMAVLCCLLVCSAPTGAGPQPGIAPARAQVLVGAASRRVVAALQTNDTATLAHYVHPLYGVRFSPYVSVVVKDEVRLGKSAVAGLKHDRRVRHWGRDDNTSAPIQGTWAQFRRFLMPRGRDFRRAPEIRYNTFPARGNLIGNLRTIYPDGIFVEYYLPNLGAAAVNWHSLWLIWQPNGKGWKLVGIAGNQWTV